ncbi:hypothetical protein [Streptomyces fuscigenes]|uniref:hypothetical protein n=1 Tax=Streptomyces fuscigenes TaxID=1528880 RepID=UPI001F20D726|nr:hypothetical protein [Streptomyces fuscigenes]MCF3960274.1 hypothetical protein [Streptomyces fuscigenes]
MSREPEYAPGGLTPAGSTMAELSARVVFVPLGYGPAVAARAARLAWVAALGRGELPAGEPFSGPDF